MYELNFEKLKKIMLNLVSDEINFSRLCKLCDVKMTKKEINLILTEIKSCKSLHDLNNKDKVILRNLMEDSILMY